MSETITSAEYKKLKKGGPKYHNQPTVIDGVRLDSKKEARRFSELKLLERAGEISNLKVHERFPLIVNSQLICVYVSDFSYTDKAGACVVEDVKSAITQQQKAPLYCMFRIKSKLMQAIHGITIREV